MAKKVQPVPKTFEEGVRELEAILSEMEAGQIGLEESLQRYERGAFLIKHCRSVLNVAQTQIESLSKSDDADDAPKQATGATAGSDGPSSDR